MPSERFASAKDVLVLHPTKKDLIKGATYASITLPWTFNRLNKNSSIKGLRERALNIAKGIVGQAVLTRYLMEKGVTVHLQKKSHRRQDLFDFRIESGEDEVKLDVKTGHHYTDYPGDTRRPFSPAIVAENSAYDGADWRQFFPMLVAHTQIAQDKDAYCFAIASSIDPRRDIDRDRPGYAITAFPYGPQMPFFNGRRLVEARERAGKGFYIGCEYIDGLFQRPLEIDLVGEWEGRITKHTLTLLPGKRSEAIGPYSCFSAVQVSRKTYDELSGSIEIDVDKNEFDEEVLSSALDNLNVPPDIVLEYTKEDFTNLVLPKDYTLYFLGWIFKDEFIEACRNYRSWVWPRDSVDRFSNQPWSQLTEKDLKTLERLGLSDRIQRDQEHLVAAGILKGTGQGGGTNCYVYPNSWGGGLQETNLYVLPQDLRKMSTLGRLG